MRRIVSMIAVATALGATVGGAVIVWRRNPRVGSALVNSVVNPRLLQRGLAGGAKSEIGTLEHFGRTSGVRRLTPVHPEPTPAGFRIMVPLGSHSQWARNVLAAGHCRLQLHDVVYELDEPAMIPAAEVHDLPSAVRGAMGALGFQYLTPNIQLQPGHVRTGRRGRFRSMTARVLRDLPRTSSASWRRRRSRPWHKNEQRPCITRRPSSGVSDYRHLRVTFLQPTMAAREPRDFGRGSIDLSRDDACSEMAAAFLTDPETDHV